MKYFFASLLLAVLLLNGCAPSDVENIAQSNPQQISTKTAKYAFPDGRWQRTDVERYAVAYYAHYGASERGAAGKWNFRPWEKDFWSLRNGPHHRDSCAAMTNANFYVGRAYNADGGPRECIFLLSNQITWEIRTQGKNSPALKYLMEELVPYWSENKAFTQRSQNNPQGGNGQDVNYQTNMYAAFKIYFAWAEYYGASAELDQSVRQWFDEVYASQRYTVRSRYWRRCPHAKIYFSPLPSGYDAPGGECNNGIAGQMVWLAWAGMYFKDEALINDSIEIFKAITDFATPEGFTHDTSRGNLGMGYSHWTAALMDETADIIKDGLGIDLYSYTGKDGARAEAVIALGVRIVLDPEIGWPVAKNGYANPGFHEMGYQNTWYGVPDDEIVPLFHNTRVRAASHLIMGNPKYADLQPYISLTHGSHADIDSWFNAYIMEKID